MKNKIKRFDYRHIICSILVIGSLLFAIFYFKYADNRLLETFIDIKNSFLYYISELFELEIEYEITVTQFSKQPFEMPLNLPDTYDDFKELWTHYWKQWASKENVEMYFTFIAVILQKISKLLIIIMPFILLIQIIVMFQEKEINNDYNIDSKMLVRWRMIVEDSIYEPIKKWIINFIDFVKLHSIYILILILIWLYNFNIYSIGD